MMVEKYMVLLCRRHRYLLRSFYISRYHDMFRDDVGAGKGLCNDVLLALRDEMNCIRA